MVRLYLGLHSDLFLGSSDQLSNQQFDSTEELHQGMLSALTDDIINLVMSLDVVHFKTMLDKSRTTIQDQDEELRRRQEVIMELECKVKIAMGYWLRRTEWYRFFFFLIICSCR